MFKHLTDLSYKRNFLEAVVFYFAYLVLALLISVLIAGILGLITGKSDSFQFGQIVGTVVVVIFVLLLSFLILIKKGLINNFGYILLALLSAFLAYFGGGLLGLIPVAFLTTRQAK